MTTVRYNLPTRDQQYVQLGADLPTTQIECRQRAVTPSFTMQSVGETDHTQLTRTGSAQAQTSYCYQVRVHLHNSLTKLRQRRQLAIRRLVGLTV